MSARCGVRAPIRPAAVPPDVGVALRLRAVRVLEEAIGDLVKRHVRVAGHALAQFSVLRLKMSGDRAQQAAIRQAGIAFHLPVSTAGDSSALIRNAPGRPDAAAPPLLGRGPGLLPDPGHWERGSSRHLALP